MFGEHVQVVCFVSCYVAAMVCEVLRLAFRGRFRRRLSLTLTVAGLAVHTLYLVARGVTVTEGLPVRTLFESLVVFAWLTAVVYLYLAWRRHDWAMGMFVLPVILAVLVVAALFPGQGPRGEKAAHTFWAAVHGTMIVVGSCAVTGAFVAGIMYLVQSRRLKAKQQPAAGMVLPSLERLERSHVRMVTLGFPLLTVGIAIGVLLKLDPASALSWHDPKLVATALCWAAFGVLLHARYAPALRGRKVAYLTLVAFAFMLFALFGVDLLLGTQHPGLEVRP